MSVFKRKTTAGTTIEYHYRFMSNGKIYYGVCAGCETIEKALSFEKEIKNTTNKLSAQKTVKGLVENFKAELLGDEPVLLLDAFDKSLLIPRKKQAGANQISEKRARFEDFVYFMKKKHANIKHLHLVTTKHANEYIIYLRENGKFNKTIQLKTKSYKTKYKSKNIKLAPSTINRYHDSVKEVFSLLNNRDETLNPFAKIPQLDDNYENREAFTQKELELILSSADNFVKSIFIVGFFTAFREGDIATLRWSDILFEDRIIRRKTLKTGVLVEIPIMPPLEEFLQSQIGKDDEYVLPDHAKMYLENKSGITYRVKTFLESVGIVTTKKVPNRSRAVSIKDVHSLRHTFCYFAGLANIPLVVVQSIVGHMTIDMTNHYTAHADRKAKREKLLLMPSLSSLVEKTIRKELINQQRNKIIEKVKIIDNETIDRIYKMLFPPRSKKLLLHNTELEKSK